MGLRNGMVKFCSFPAGKCQTLGLSEMSGASDLLGEGSATAATKIVRRAAPVRAGDISRGIVEAARHLSTKLE